MTAYEPSQEIENISHSNITLRARGNRRFEANLVEFSLPLTYDDALQSTQKHEWCQAIKEGVNLNKNCVLKLNKSLYGLKQASRCWNKRFSNFLIKYGFVQSQAENCIFIGIFNKIKIFLILYVDDALVISASKLLIQEIIEYLMQVFKIKILNLKYFVGMEIQRINGYIYIHQRDYIEQVIEKFCMSNANPVSTPADANVIITKNVDESTIHFPYREAIGSLLFLCSVSRPDISYAVNVLSRYVNNPGQLHVKCCEAYHKIPN